jgi:hypothetical protein
MSLLSEPTAHAPVPLPIRRDVTVHSAASRVHRVPHAKLTPNIIDRRTAERIGMREHREQRHRRSSRMTLMFSPAIPCGR